MSNNLFPIRFLVDKNNRKIFICRIMKNFFTITAAVSRNANSASICKFKSNPSILNRVMTQVLLHNLTKINSHWEPPLPNALRLGWFMGRGEPYGGHFPRAQGKISTPSYHNKPKRKGLLLTTLQSPSTMTKKGEKSKITSRENWRKDLKFTEILKWEGLQRET